MENFYFEKKGKGPTQFVLYIETAILILAAIFNEPVHKTYGLVFNILVTLFLYALCLKEGKKLSEIGKANLIVFCSIIALG